MPAVRLKFLCAMLAGSRPHGPLPGLADAAPNDEVFTVGNYPVDADAANAVAAKQKAHGRRPAGRLPLAAEARSCPSPPTTA